MLKLFELVLGGLYEASHQVARELRDVVRASLSTHAIRLQLLLFHASRWNLQVRLILSHEKFLRCHL